MSLHICSGASMLCSFGAAPSALVVLPLKRCLTSSQPAATIMDNIPFVNIPPFGVCSSLANPATASATSAALGVLTPMPCTPVIPAPWAPGSPMVLLGGMPALNQTSMLTCAYGGVITITAPTQFTEMVP
ncbi:MAG: DUF4280 domain-containing protein [Verrucomicrobiales bacterium]|nr:DUF4280 domain-containing protein [Verrucomicrobiales bacterium]